MPTTRRELAKAERQRRREDRETARRALVAGDEKALPARDRGPVRRFVRDTVDARRSPGEVFLYVAFLVLGLSLVRSPAVQSIGLLVMLTLTLLIALDMIFFSRKLRRLLRERFPKENTAGAVGYGVLRSTQIRRMRLPPPTVGPRGKVVKKA